MNSVDYWVSLAVQPSYLNRSKIVGTLGGEPPRSAAHQKKREVKGSWRFPGSSQLATPKNHVCCFKWKLKLKTASKDKPTLQCQAMHELSKVSEEGQPLDLATRPCKVEWMAKKNTFLVDR